MTYAPGCPTSTCDPQTKLDRLCSRARCARHARHGGSNHSRGALARADTRGAHNRADFPELDGKVLVNFLSVRQEGREAMGSRTNAGSSVPDVRSSQREGRIRTAGTPRMCRPGRGHFDEITSSRRRCAQKGQLVAAAITRPLSPLSVPEGIEGHDTPACNEVRTPQSLQDSRGGSVRPESAATSMPCGRSRRGARPRRRSRGGSRPTPRRCTTR
jgi:hypothetical protein